jgi:hypothetical protein
MITAGLSLTATVACFGGATDEILPTSTVSTAQATVSEPSSTPSKTASPVPTNRPSQATLTSQPTITVQVPTIEPTVEILPTPTVVDSIRATETPISSPAPISPTATPVSLVATVAAMTTTPVAISTPPPTAAPVPTPSIEPSPSPTATPVGPTPTAFVPPTSTPTTVPSPTPIPTADARFALIVGGRDNSEAAYFANTLSVDWYLDYGASPSVDPGLSKLRAIMLESGFHPYSDAEIIDMVSADPGSYFQIGNEPNIFEDAVHLPAGYAEALNYYATRIKAADSTAKIVGPNILNFDFTCIGCGGYTSGHTWIEQMRQSYLSSYGTEPPIDVWAIHQYPLDWFNFPTVNDAILTQDLDAFRSYLDSLPGQSGSEIWITEFGLHWGFEALQFQEDGTLEPCDPAVVSRCWPGPVGEYMTSEVINYLDRLTSFYKSNSARLNLQRWFLWRHNYSFGPNPSGTNGLTLFDSFYEGGVLTPVGTAYRNLIFGG